VQSPRNVFCWWLFAMRNPDLIHPDDETHHPSDFTSWTFLFSVYHDHIDKDEQWVRQRLASDDGHARTVRDADRREVFPVKLHMMIEATSTSTHADIIRWQSHGRAFKVFDRERLVSQVLPHYLPGQKQFSSFQRQLNTYEFLKLTGSSNDKGAYYHEFFLHGRPFLSWLIFRKD
jgi:HSF-type DNA-binding